MKTLRCAVVLLALAGCAVSATQPEIDMATETLSDLQKPWGMREFAVVTPDGHRIVFGEKLTA
jgi:hypothetical protein